MTKLFTQLVIEDDCPQVTEAFNLNDRSSVENGAPGSSHVPITLGELRNSLILPPESGWGWWSPGLKMTAASAQYINECHMVNDRIVLKTIKIDLIDWATYMPLRKNLI